MLMEENEVTKADIKQFIRDVTSCGYYNRRIIAITNRLEDIHVQLVGVKSIAPKPYIIENKRPFSMQGINSLIADEEKYILERDGYVKKINEVRIIFDKLPLQIQNMMVDLYICGYNHTKVAKKYCYNRSHMYRLINKNIKSTLTNCLSQLK